MAIEIEICVQALKHTLGLIDHYYMVIGDHEYHPGFYSRGCILPVGTTKGYHVAFRRTVCRDCLDFIILNFNLREDKRILNLYPLLNCESFTTGFSVQSVAFCAVPFIGLLFLNGQTIYAILLILSVILTMLLHSKYVFSRTIRQRCEHLTDKGEIRTRDDDDDDKV